MMSLRTVWNTSVGIMFNRCDLLRRALVIALVAIGPWTGNQAVNGAGPTATPVLEWIRQFGTGGQDLGAGLAANQQGKVVVAGFVSSTLAAPYAGGGGDIFLRRLDGSGSTDWTSQFGTNQDEQATSVSMDQSGSILVSGWTKGNLGVTNSGAEDAFLSKYDASGSRLWTRLLGSASNDFSFGVTSDASGNSFITGQTCGDLSTKIAIGHPEAFLAKYDSGGSLLWSRQFGPHAEQLSRGVATDLSGNAFISGWTRNTQISANAYNPFVSKYDSNGYLQWTRQLGATNDAVSAGVTTDGSGNVYIAGTTSGNLNGVVGGSSDSFVAKYNNVGDRLWVRQFGSNGNENTNGVAADLQGNVYVSGYTTGDLGNVNAGINDAFIAKYDTSGNLRWIGQLGTQGSDQAYAVATDGLGGVYISGYTEGTVDGSSAGSTDVFVAKFIDVPEPSSAMVLVMPLAVVFLATRLRVTSDRRTVRN